MTCRISGCHGVAGRYSQLCRHHRTTKRLRGAPDQGGLTPTQLKPFRKIVDQYMIHNGYGEKVLPIFTQVWSQLLHEGTGPKREWEQGKACRYYEVEAATELEGIRTTADLNEILPLVVSLYLFREYNPRFFVSHDAFLVTLQRLVRKAAAGGYDLVWNATRGEYAKKLRGLKLRAAVALGRWMNDNFAPNCGVLAVEIAKHLNKKADRNQLITQAVHDLRDAWRSDEGGQPTLHAEQGQGATV